jgi:hypothetical protein
MRTMKWPTQAWATVEKMSSNKSESRTMTLLLLFATNNRSLLSDFLFF